MKLVLLNIDDFVKRNSLTEIKRTVVFSKPGVLDPEGLHSPSIYETDEDKKKKLCYIDIGRPFVHPLLLYITKRRSKMLYDGLMGHHPLVVKNGKLEYSSTDQGYMCTELLKYLYENRDKIELPLSIKNILSNATLSALLPSKVIVVPPVFRPFSIDVKGVVLHPLDLIYTQFGMFKRVYDEVVLYALLDKLVNHIILSLKGKGGLLRSQLLTRRTDFSARLVITVDPTLDIDYVKIPNRVLAMLFAFHVARVLKNPPSVIKSIMSKIGFKVVQTNEEALALVTAYYKRELSPELEDLFKEVIKEVVKDKVIVAKRDPVLHRGSVFAFRPIGVDVSQVGTEVYTMAISPYITTPIGGDFDGDTMCVFAPQTIEAQEEALSLLPSNNRFNSGRGDVHFPLKLDYLVALYILTSQKLPQALSYGKATPLTFTYPSKSNLKEVIESKKDVSFQAISYVNINGRTVRTTFGRFLFNITHNSEEFFNETIDKDTQQTIVSRLNTILSREQLFAFYKNVSILCEFVLKRFPLSLDLEKMLVTDTYVADLRKEKDPFAFSRKLKDYTNETLVKLESTNPAIPIYLRSGARGSPSDVQQLLLARGFVTDPLGFTKPEPVKGNYTYGLSPDDIYKSAPGWRKGIIDKSLGTADAGYLTRKMIYLLNHLTISGRDCRTTTGLTLKNGDQHVDRRSINGRYLMDGTLITPKTQLPNQFTIRSPLYCRDPRGICEVCYGTLFNVHKCSQIGLIAAQTLGERGTQLTMKTFHTGGVGGLFVTIKLPPFLKQRKTWIVADTDISFIVDMEMDTFKSTIEGIIIYPQTLEVIVGKEIHKWELEVALRIPREVRPHVLSSHQLMYSFSREEVVGEILGLSGGVTSLVMLVNKMIDSPNPSQSFVDYCLTLYEYYKTVAILPLVHFEVLTSVLTRVSSNVEQLWRLRQNETPVLVSFGEAIGSTSPLTALLFADPGVGIMKMLYNEVKDVGSIGGLVL